MRLLLVREFVEVCCLLKTTATKIASNINLIYQLRPIINAPENKKNKISNAFDMKSLKWCQKYTQYCRNWNLNSPVSSSKTFTDESGVKLIIQNSGTSPLNKLDNPIPTIVSIIPMPNIGGSYLGPHENQDQLCFVAHSKWLLQLKRWCVIYVICDIYVQMCR